MFSDRKVPRQPSGGWLLLFGGCTGVVPAGGGVVVVLVGGAYVALSGGAYVPLSERGGA